MAKSIGCLDQGEGVYGSGGFTETSPSKHKTLYNICIMLDQRRTRWDDVVQMLCKCFVLAG